DLRRRAQARRRRTAGPPGDQGGRCGRLRAARRHHRGADARLRRAVLSAARPSRVPAGAQTGRAGMTRWLKAEEIERLAADPARRMRIPGLPAIDHTRPFVPETYTQLYYTPVYAKLHREHRLRYNQLFGLRINEYIMMLEADLVERLLSRLRGRRDVAADPA